MTRPLTSQQAQSLINRQQVGSIPDGWTWFAETSDLEATYETLEAPCAVWIIGSHDMPNPVMVIGYPSPILKQMSMFNE